jgi:hypothetical protein
VNAILRTNDDSKYLALLNIERFEDGSGYGADLVVRSDGYAGNLKFYFEVAPLERFVQALDRMDDELKGAATLKPNYEEPFVKLEVHKTGAVSVSGELVIHADFTHRLTFGFKTDQTCLAPFARDLRTCLVSQAV